MDLHLGGPRSPEMAPPVAASATAVAATAAAQDKTRHPLCRLGSLQAVGAFGQAHGTVGRGHGNELAVEK